MRTIFFFLLLCAPILAQPPKANFPLESKPPAQPLPPPAPVIQIPDAVLTHTEVDAMPWVFNALLEYPEIDWPFIRFVYVPAWGDAEWPYAVDVAINSAVSHSPILQKGDRHAGGWLLAYNFKRLCPQPAKLQRALEVWDGLAQFDSRFHLSTVNVQEVVTIVEEPEFDQFKRPVLDPRTGKQRVKPRNVVTKTNVKSAFLAPHLQAALAKHATNPEKSKRIDELVAKMSHSAGIVLPADFVIEQTLTSLVGKYLDFRQVQLKVSTGNPLDNLLKERGFNFDLSQDVQGDKSALILWSDITGKTRIVSTVYGFGSGRPLVGTFDIADARVRPDQKFIRNLVEYEALADAGDWFVPMPNGLVEFILSDKNKNILKAAPSSIVSDDEKPKGHTKDLESGMSCILCHRYQDGYRTARNDMEFLLGADTDYFGGDFFYTNSSGKKVPLTHEEAIALVTSRYGDRIDLPDGPLGRARRDLIKAYTMLSNYEIKSDGPSPVELVGNKIKEIYHGFRYRRYDADRICEELGVKVKPGLGKAMLKKLAPAPPIGVEEDLLIGMVRNGAVVRRDDVDAFYTELARRAVVTKPQLLKEK